MLHSPPALLHSTVMVEVSIVVFPSFTDPVVFVSLRDLNHAPAGVAGIARRTSAVMSAVSSFILVMGHPWGWGALSRGCHWGLRLDRATSTGRTQVLGSVKARWLEFWMIARPHESLADGPLLHSRLSRGADRSWQNVSDPVARPAGAHGGWHVPALTSGGNARAPRLMASRRVYTPRRAFRPSGPGIGPWAFWEPLIWRL